MLFRMLSGSTGLAFNAKTDVAKKHTLWVSHELGCATDGENGQSQKTIDCLRDVPMARLMNVSVARARAERPVFGELYYSVSVDGDILTDRPSELIRSERIAQGVPLILSWVANDGAWYPPPFTSTDDEVVASFKSLMFNLSPSTIKEMLALYPVSDFDHMVAERGSISPQYFRAAQINRDIWFTCPSLDFAYQYARHGGVRSDQIRIFTLNSTRYGPVFEMMGVPMWGVSHLSDVPYVMNLQHLDAGADNSADQLSLGRLISSSLVRFARNGDPVGSLSGVAEWPAAFESAKDDVPEALIVQSFGGPLQSEVATIGAKGSLSAAARTLAQQKILDRCDFLNSARVRSELGS